MSQAFVREGEEQWLHDVAPTVHALLYYLTRENNGIRVYERQRLVRDHREIYVMSNGMSYARDASGKWEIID